MKYRCLVMDAGALQTLANASIDQSWYQSFELPPTQEVRRVERSSCVYLLSRHANETSRLVVVNLEANRALRTTSQRYSFDRILHVALSAFEATIFIPVTWRSYNEGTFLSIYANPAVVGNGERLYFDRSPDSTDHLYAYGSTDGAERFDNVPEDITLFRTALNGYLDAVLQPVAEPPKEGNFGITLAESFAYADFGGGLLDEWYNNKLTAAQRKFVDASCDSPVRLKGPAGSGKTIAMAIKCLREAYKGEDAGRKLRIAFLTHSSALSHEVIPSMLYSFDPSGRWRHMNHVDMVVGSIYEVAQDLLEYQKKDLRPLSLDGKEGRDWQALLIHDAIDSCLANTKFYHHTFGKCTPTFQRQLQDASYRQILVAEAMNEFASVVDSEGVRLGNSAAEKYLRAPREEWQMRLDSTDDRMAFLQVHEAYCKALEGSRALSMDQMISDLNKYLSTNEWRQLREHRGFDVIFVDEFHYFKASERMIFHELFRASAAATGRLPLFMAYDLKQSPTDVAMAFGKNGNIGNAFKGVQAGQSELVELSEVFRYSPEMAQFLSDLDGAFPAMGFGADWSVYAAKSRAESGEKPVLTVYESDLKLLDEVFKMAVASGRRLGAGKEVAVLCMNDELFGKYLSYGRIAGKYTKVASRDDVRELRYAGKKPIFSMPEYVAGLQFGEVYLIHVDRRDNSDDETVGRRRRFVSRCYLGSSRAVKSLFIASSQERGGEADVLAGPISQGSLIRG